MTTPRPTAIHALSRRAALQCWDSVAFVATAWPASATVPAVEAGGGGMPASVAAGMADLP